MNNIPNSSKIDASPEHSLRASIYTRTGLFCEYPLAQDSLHTFNKLPAKPKNPRPLNRYNYRDQNVYCHACGRHNHYMGITVQLDDDKKALIGNCCAEAYFGKDAYRRVEKELKEREDKAYYTEAIKPLDDKLSAALNECEKIEPLLRALDQNWDAFKKHFPAQAESLHHAAFRNQGKLTFDRKTLNFVSIQKGTGRKIEYVTEIMGILRGGSFLTKKEKLVTYLSRIKANLLGARTRLSRKPDRTPELKAILFMVQDCHRQAVRLIEFAEHGVSFFTRDNFVLITNWLDRRGRGHIYVDGFKEVPCKELIFSQTKLSFERPSTNLVELLSYHPKLIA